MTPYTVDALQRIVGRNAQVYDYAEDFNKLWSMNLPAATRVVVVWADTPSDPTVQPVHTEPYITPLDWAIAAYCRIAGLRVTVVDFRRDRYKAEEYKTLRWLCTQNPGCVPWLRYVTITQLLDHSAEDILKLLAPSDKSDAQIIIDAREAVRELAVCREDRESGRDDHHAIANLIGPMLMLQKGPQKSGSDNADHREALWQILQSAGLKRENSQDDRVIDFAELGDTKIVLLDDQWHHGWAEWLCSRLGLSWNGSHAAMLEERARIEPQRVSWDASKGVSLWVTSSPRWLGDRLKSAIRDSRKADARFELRLIDDGSACAEILLLDLRLFPDESRETEFVKEVAELTDRFRKKAPWRKLTETPNDIKVSKGIAPNFAERAKKRTLLARLLANVDLSLPVVLFSSTGLRENIEELRAYQSIICEFQKPRVLGDTSRSGTQTNRAFSRAMEKAKKIAKARSEILAIKELAGKATAPNSGTHLEIYVDESGKFGDDGESRVGGLIVTYPSLGVAESFADTLLKAKEPFHWGYHREMRELPSQKSIRRLIKIRGYLPKYAAKKFKRERLMILERLASDHKIFISTGFIVSGGSSGDDSTISFDAIYGQSLRRFVELTLDSWTSSQVKSVDIFIATRGYNSRRKDSIEVAGEFCDMATRFGKKLTLRKVRDGRVDESEEADSSGSEEELEPSEEAVSAVTEGDTQQVPNQDAARDAESRARFYKLKLDDFSALRRKAPELASKLVLAEVDGTDFYIIPEAQCEEKSDIPTELNGPDEFVVYAKSFDYDDALTLLSEIFSTGSGRRGEQWKGRLLSAVGVDLRPYAKKPGSGFAFPGRLRKLPMYLLPRLVHYAADWVLGNDRDSVTPEAWINRGFVEDLAAADHLEAAFRHLNEDRLVDAIAAWRKLRRSEVISQARYAAAAALSQAIDQMEGMHFADIAGLS